MTTKLRKNVKLLTLTDIINARTEYMAGVNLSLLSDKFNVPEHTLLTRIEELGRFLTIENSALTVEQKEIRSIILPKMQEVHDKLTKGSLDIVTAADEHTLKNIDDPRLTAKDTTQISDIHSKRLARLNKGLEESPDTPVQDSSRVTTIIQNIFNVTSTRQDN